MSINLQKVKNFPRQRSRRRPYEHHHGPRLGRSTAREKGMFGFLGGNKEVDVDLDASCILFDEQNNAVDAVWFRQLRSKDGSIQHTGDNRTGAGDGDDEQIIVNLAQVPANIKSLVFTVNSFTGQNFSQIANATVRLVNAANNSEVARFNLSGLGNYNAQIMAKCTATTANGNYTLLVKPPMAARLMN